MNLGTILLQAAPAGAEGGGGFFNMNILMIVLLIVVFYLFLIRPQQKRQKEIKKFREALKVGDKVITNGGIYAKIKEIKDDHFILEIANNANIKIDKASVFANPADTQPAR